VTTIIGWSYLFNWVSYKVYACSASQSSPCSVKEDGEYLTAEYGNG